MKIETQASSNQVFSHRFHDLQDRNSARAVADDRFMLMVRALNTLVSEKDPVQALSRLLTAITKELGAHSSALWIFNSSWEMISLYESENCFGAEKNCGSENLPPETRFGPLKRDGMAQVMSQGPMVIRDAAGSRLVEPKRRKWLAANGIRSLFCVPLPACGKLTGVLTIRASKPDAFEPGDEKLGNLLSLLAGLAVRAIKMSEHAEERAVLQERERFAEEIHDSLQQNLAAIVTRLELALDVFPANAEEAFEHVRQAQELARDGVTEARRTVWALAPLALADRNLPVALEKFSSRLSDGAGFDVDFSSRGTPRRLSQKTETNLLRITQEAINNALRHGHATRVQIKLDYTPENVTLTVVDNGRGFESSEASKNRGFGLLSLRDRTRKSGGNLTISSSSGSGTRIVVAVPSTTGKS